MRKIGMFLLIIFAVVLPLTMQEDDSTGGGPVVINTEGFIYTTRLGDVSVSEILPLRTEAQRIANPLLGRQSVVISPDANTC